MKEKVMCRVLGTELESVCITRRQSNEIEWKVTE